MDLLIKEGVLSQIKKTSVKRSSFILSTRHRFFSSFGGSCGTEKHSRLPVVGIENNLETLRKCLQLSRVIEDVHNSNL